MILFIAEFTLHDPSSKTSIVLSRSDAKDGLIPQMPSLRKPQSTPRRYRGCFARASGRRTPSRPHADGHAHGWPADVMVPHPRLWGFIGAPIEGPPSVQTRPPWPPSRKASPNGPHECPEPQGLMAHGISKAGRRISAFLSDGQHSTGRPCGSRAYPGHQGG